MPQTVALAWLQRTCESSWSFLAVHFPKASLNGSTRPGRRHKVVPCTAAAFLDWKGFKICMETTSNDKHLSVCAWELHAYWIYFAIASMWLLVFIIYCNVIINYIFKIHFYFLYTMVVYIFIMFMCKRNIKLTYFPSCRIDINITWTCFSSCIQEIKRLLISTILFSEKTIHDYNTVEDSGWAIDLDYFTDASSTLQEGCLQAYWIY